MRIQKLSHNLTDRSLQSHATCDCYLQPVPFLHLALLIVTLALALMLALSL